MAVILPREGNGLSLRADARVLAALLISSKPFSGPCVPDLNFPLGYLNTVIEDKYAPELKHRTYSRNIIPPPSAALCVRTRSFPLFISDDCFVFYKTNDSTNLEFKDVQGVQAFGVSGPHWKKRSCLGLHIKYTNTNGN